MTQISWSFDKIGPITRSADDCEAIFYAISGPDAGDPTTRDPLVCSLSWPPRLGILPIPDGYKPIEKVFLSAIEAFRNAGAVLEDAYLPAHDYRGIFDRILSYETAHRLRGFINSSLVDQVIDDYQRAALIDLRTTDSEEDYSSARLDCARAVEDIKGVFRSFDALLMPTILSEAPMLTDDLEDWEARRRQLMLVGALTGGAGITVPMGFGETGMPLGLTIFGDLGSDLKVLEIAKLFQVFSDWHLQRPARDAVDRPSRDPRHG